MKILHCLCAGSLLAVGLLAQDAPPPARQRIAAPGTHGPDRMYTSLNMTDAQKQQAKTIFDEAHLASRSIHQSLKQIHQSVDAAIQAGKSPSEIEQMAQAEGPLQAQLAGIDAAARAKFYQSLTPDQQQKFIAMRKRGPGPGGPGGANPMGRPGRRPPPPPPAI